MGIEIVILICLVIGWLVYDIYNYHEKRGNKYYIYVGRNVDKYNKATIGLLLK